MLRALQNAQGPTKGRTLYGCLCIHVWVRADPKVVLHFARASPPEGPCGPQASPKKFELETRSWLLLDDLNFLGFYQA